MANKINKETNSTKIEQLEKEEFESFLSKFRTKRNKVKYGPEFEEIFWRHYFQLCEYAKSQFEWHGLPESINVRYLESVLLARGSAAVYNIKNTGIILASEYANRDIDVYGYPINISPALPNNKMNLTEHDIDQDTVIIAWDNQTNYNIIQDIIMFAKRLTKIYITTNMNLDLMKRPYIMKVNKQDKAAEANAKAMMMNLDTFEPIIVMDDTVNVDVMNTTVPDNTKSLTDIYNETWKQAFAFLGISSETTKRERMLDQELTMNRQSDQIRLYSRLQPRVELANELNRIYGLDVKVNLSTEKFDEKGEADGEIHDYTQRSSATTQSESSDAQ